MAEHFAADGETSPAAEAGPERGLAPVVVGEKLEEQIAFEGWGEEAVFGIVEGAEGVVGFGPQAGGAEGVEEFDLFAGLGEIRGGLAIGSAAEETGSGGRAGGGGAEDAFEAAADEGVGVEDVVGAVGCDGVGRVEFWSDDRISSG